MLEIDIGDAEQHLDQDDLDEDEELSGEEIQLRLSVGRATSVRYQQNLTANFHLPYSDLLDEEAAQWLVEMKEGLAKSVLTGDYRPGLVLWIGRLEQYLRLYGRRFTKQDHIMLVKFFFELLTDKNMEPAIVSRSTQVFCVSVLIILVTFSYMSTSGAVTTIVGRAFFRFFNDFRLRFFSLMI